MGEQSSAVYTPQSHFKQCGSCRYWDTDGTDYGTCRLPQLTPYTGFKATDGGTVTTRSTFGCVQYAVIGHYGGQL